VSGDAEMAETREFKLNTPDPTQFLMRLADDMARTGQLYPFLVVDLCLLSSSFNAT
jgi:hypothetical protein